MNVDKLEQQHRKYLNRNSMSFTTRTVDLFSISDEAYMKIRDALGDLPEEDKDAIIEMMIVSERSKDARFVEITLEDAECTAYAFEKETGISQDILNQVLRKKISLPKTFFFAIEIVFAKNWEHVKRDMQFLGIALTNEFPDVLFQQYIQNEIYTLDDYVKTVKATAEALKEDGVDVKLPNFYNNDYTNHVFQGLR